MSNYEHFTGNASNWNWQRNSSQFNAPNFVSPPSFLPPANVPPPPMRYNAPLHVPPPTIDYHTTPNNRFTSPPQITSNSFSQFQPCEVKPHPYKKADNHPTIPVVTETVQDKLNHWMKTNNLVASAVDSKKHPSHSGELTLSTVKLMLHKLNVLRLMLRDTWTKDHLCTATREHRESLRKEMQDLLVVLEDSHTQDIVKSKVVAAQKRKARRRKQKQNVWEAKQARQKHIDAKHKEVDQWLEGIQELKRTEQVKKAADESMSGVRQKIADVTKQKELIAALTKLRSIREGNQSLSHGVIHDSEARDRFGKKTSELIKLLDGRLELYKKEEKALKVMLDSEHEETLAREARIAAVRKQRKHDRLEKRKELWLFGSQDVRRELQPFHDYYTQAQTDFDRFIHIRREWDSYLVGENVPGASYIPRGWVLPTEPSSQLWQRYLKPPDNVETNSDVR